MANPRAQAAKEKGNAAFKSGDFPNAIGHYTEAILADRTDPTFPLNRAAAYLKLGKNEDAERDSTTVLRLSPSNVKALFRRAQARVELEKLLEARQDLTDALKLEPTNSSVRDELKKVDQLVSIEKSKKSARSTTSPAGQPAPKRRRVPIEVVEPPSEAPSTTPIAVPSSSSSPVPPTTTMTPVSTRSLKSPPQPAPTITPTTTTPTPPPPPKPSPSTFSEAKAARETSKPSRVGVGSGGIFRANGQNTIFPKDRTPTTGSSQPTNANGERYPATVVAPMTMFTFNKTWEANRSIEDRWKLITSIPPTSIPSMCKSSLEPSLFISIIDVFLHVVKSHGEATTTTEGVIKDYLKGFEIVPRFNTVLLFLSEKEKSRVRELWTLLGIQRG